QNFALLPSNERKDRTLAQIAERRVHPAGNAAVAGRCAAAGGGLRRTLQQRPPEQRGWLHHAEGHARRASAGDPRREGSEVGGSTKTASDSSAAGRVICLGHFPRCPFSRKLPWTVFTGFANTTESGMTHVPRRP